MSRYLIEAGYTGESFAALDKVSALRLLAEVLQHEAEVAATDRDVGVVGAVGGFGDRQRPLELDARRRQLTEILQHDHFAP